MADSGDFRVCSLAGLDCDDGRFVVMAGDCPRTCRMD